jgi:hypothetical protein
LSSSDVDWISDADLARCGAVAFVAKDRLAVIDLDGLLDGEVGEPKASPV